MSGGSNMIKPSSIDNLPYLSEEKKNYYKSGLAGLWTQYENSPKGSPAWQAAENKIKAASNKLMQEWQNASKGQVGGPRPGSGGGPPAPQQQQQGLARPPTQGGMSGAPQQMGGQAPTQPQPLSQTAQTDLRSVNVAVPASLPQASHAKYKTDWFQRASTILRARDGWVQKGKTATQHSTNLKNQGLEVPQNVTAVLEAARRGVNDTTLQWNQMKADNEQKRQTNAAMAAQQTPQSNGAPPNPYQGNNGGQAEVKVEPNTSVSPQQPQGTFQQQQQQPQQTANAQTPNVNMSQTTQTATQPQPPQNFPQQPPPQQQQQYAPQQQRPQMNQQQSQQQMQYQQPPAQPAPNNAQQPQRPQALTQRDAMEQAAASYRGQQQQQQNQMSNNQAQSNAAQQPNGLPFNTPGSMQQQSGTPGSAYPHQQQSLTGTPTQGTKFPITKNMQLDPRSVGHQPVQAPPSRPTMGNTGMMQQPGLARPPTYTLEGEGDHVLSKRKLDELVRQVTGTAGSSSSTDSSSASLLAPEVEENIMSLADDFVDDLITAACKLAKLRPGPQNVLEIRDIQIVLERNYGMRVPGYALEETRTVKKFAPAAGWQSKMQAVQTAKTLGGGKGE
ncbi:Transcription initiation factor TFIID subunit 12 [Elasticomyces elasticus]|nr:Transcription initiation factor TFIID subunit 12 [Elasticomyces elasticus]KAK3663274.1 Transcription initiation factor TFIID subunit 12 [Elasticomyces elasticus]KAK4929069.1 Transcription initiation factor TFIID subunit 12 [Elasticomyces elasticus]KAK5766448.1 Transcription initiation factor TFIID subunit 12 [Elasticomyces elasticus]